MNPLSYTELEPRNPRVRLYQIVNSIEICAIYGLLDFSGDDWPQPHRVMGIRERWDWEAIEALMREAESYERG